MSVQTIGELYATEYLGSPQSQSLEDLAGLPVGSDDFVRAADELLHIPSHDPDIWQQQLGTIADRFGQLGSSQADAELDRHKEELVRERANQIATSYSLAGNDIELMTLANQATFLDGLAGLLNIKIEVEEDPAPATSSVPAESAQQHDTATVGHNHPHWLAKAGQIRLGRGSMATLALTTTVTVAAFAGTSGAQAEELPSGVTPVSYSKTVPMPSKAGDVSEKVDLSFLDTSSSTVGSADTPPANAGDVAKPSQPGKVDLDQILKGSGTVTSKDSNNPLPATPSESPIPQVPQSNGNNEQGNSPGEKPPAADKPAKPAKPPKSKEPKPAPKKSPEMSPVAAKRQNFVPLFKLIADHEGNDNYNSYYGHGNNHSIIFTSMTIGQVLQWQRGYLSSSGSISAAAGLYQYMPGTLASLCKGNNIPLSTQFTPDVQDGLAIDLMKSQGHLNSYLNGSISDKQMAHNLATIWASFPKVTGSNPSSSVYPYPNRATVSVSELLSAVRALKDQSLNNAEPISQPKPKKSVSTEVNGFPNTADMSCEAGKDLGVVTTAMGNQILLCDINGAKVNASISKRVANLFEAARNAGYDLTVTSSFRSAEEQKQLREQYCGTTNYDIYKKPANQCTANVAPVGDSLHQNGYAMDLGLKGVALTNTSAPVYQWLEGYAQKTGDWWNLKDYRDSVHWQVLPPANNYANTPLPALYANTQPPATTTGPSQPPTTPTQPSQPAKPSQPKTSLGFLNSSGTTEGNASTSNNTSTSGAPSPGESTPSSANTGSSSESTPSSNGDTGSSKVNLGDILSGSGSVSGGSNDTPSQPSTPPESNPSQTPTPSTSGESTPSDQPSDGPSTTSPETSLPDNSTPNQTPQAPTDGQTQSAGSSGNAIDSIISALIPGL